MPLSPLLAALCLAAPAPAQDDAALVRWYDVRSLTFSAPDDGRGVDLRLHVSSSSLYVLEPSRWDLDLEPAFDLADESLDGVIDDLLSDRPELDGADVDEREGYLRVVGSASVHAEVARILADLAQITMDAVDIDLVRLGPDAWPADGGAVLSAAEARALLADAAPRSRTRHRVRMGRRAMLGEAAFVGALVDYDVEVAQGAVAADPLVTVLRPGLTVGAFVRRSASGRLLVKTWGRDGALAGEAPSVGVGELAGARITLPRMTTSLWTSSAELEPGGALVVGQDQTGAGPLVMRVTATALGADATSPFLPLGELVALPMSLARVRPRHAEPSGGWSVPDVDMKEHESVLDASDIADALYDLRREEGLEGRLAQLGDVLYLPDAGTLRARARETVAGLAVEMASITYAVDLRWDVLPGAAAAALLDEPAGSLAGRLGRRVQGAVRSGDALVIAGGTEAAYLQDIDVEIAQASSIGDPIVATVFEGLSLWCQPIHSGPGRVSTWLDLTVHGPPTITEQAVGRWKPKPATELDELPQPIGEFVLDASVQVVSSPRARERRFVDTREGEWTLVAATGMAGTDQTLLAVARWTRR